jgi:hypothetical protein
MSRSLVEIFPLVGCSGVTGGQVEPEQTPALMQGRLVGLGRDAGV